MIDASPSSATATAIEDCWVLRLTHEELRRHTQEDLGFGMRFYRSLAVFLSSRLRSQAVLEFDEETGLLEGQEQKGELDMGMLDNIHVAGARFDRILKKMMAVPFTEHSGTQE